MNISSRAAPQLRQLPPADCAQVLDALRDREFKAGASIVEISTPEHAYRCFVARHKDGSLVLLSVLASKPRGP